MHEIWIGEMQTHLGMRHNCTVCCNKYFSGDLCRERWKRLRDNHRKAFKTSKTKKWTSGIKNEGSKIWKIIKFLILYIFDEETRHSKEFFAFNFYHRLNIVMKIRVAKAWSVISTQHIAILPLPLGLRHLMPPLIVYNRTEQKELIPRRTFCGIHSWRYLWSKKNQASSEDTLTNFLVCHKPWRLFLHEIRSKLKENDSKWWILQKWELPWWIPVHRK